MNDDEYHFVDWPDDDELKELQESSLEYPHTMSVSDIQRNAESAKAQIQFLIESNVSGDWPDVRAWQENPENLANDFRKFYSIFKKLVDYDPDNGSYFANDPPAMMTWIVASHSFPPAIQAASACMQIPINPANINRVVELVSAFNKRESRSSPVFDDNGKDNGTRFYLEPLAFEEQKRLCGECLRILAQEEKSLQHFLKLTETVSNAPEREAQGPQFSASVSSGRVEKANAFQWLFGEPLGDVADEAGLLSYYAKFPCELATELVEDFTEIAALDVMTIHDNRAVWFSSPLLQEFEYYRLLQSLLPQCPVSFSSFTGLRDAIESKEQARFEEVLEVVRKDLQLFSKWVEAAGLWKLSPEKETEHFKPKNTNEETSPTPPQVPQWNSETGDLRIGDYVRRFSRQARAVWSLLDLFQANGWTSFAKPRSDRSQMERALRTLREETDMPIVFGRNGDGFEWNWKPNTTTAKLPPNRSGTAGQ
ncbi:MAG: hypothetical protein JNL58_05600 [Planctomyces sp.]|nr:hypothetical protein [Planctomyces sp.]